MTAEQQGTYFTGRYIKQVVLKDTPETEPYFHEKTWRRTFRPSRRKLPWKQGTSTYRSWSCFCMVAPLLGTLPSATSTKFSGISLGMPMTTLFRTCLNGAQLDDGNGNGKGLPLQQTILSKPCEPSIISVVISIYFWKNYWYQAQIWCPHSRTTEYYYQYQCIPWKSTKGWFICFHRKDSSTTWGKLTSPQRVSPCVDCWFYNPNGCGSLPCFNWWVFHIQKKWETIISLSSNKTPITWNDM